MASVVLTTLLRSVLLYGRREGINNDLNLHITATLIPTHCNIGDVQRILHEVDGRTYGKESFEGKYPKINRVGICYA